MDGWMDGWMICLKWFKSCRIDERYAIATQVVMDNPAVRPANPLLRTVID